jgi:enoyl-CoA hydratase/carnithine racemase
MSGQPEITVDVDGHVATITLDRPAKLNAMTPEMTDGLRAAVDEADERDDVRVVVLTGAGDRAFCVGSDVGELDRYDTPWEFRNRPDYCDAVRTMRTPSIAAVNGYAYGGGLELALSCDIRLAATTASFAAPEIKLGWIGGGGMSAFLAASVGPSNAAVMLMTGDPIDAETALTWGLVSEAVDPDDLLSTAAELAGRIAARAPIAAQTAKANLRAAYAMPLEDAIRYERDLQTVCMATEDAAEGRAAFAEKRTPEFRGR